ncbi:MAG TPA: polysaccharide deacetylase family protein [Candidatus Acidoferrales bacterium]|nr:polysaccharide deacetylase family protein [Candidatus Acidoferrales bacterium]
MRPTFELPNNAKIAMSVFVAFEAFIRHSQYRRSGERPDPASLAFGEFGARVGIWRIMDLLNKYGVKGTIDTNGLVAQQCPQAVRELDQSGHEIVGHGWANDLYLDAVEPEKERQIISDTLRTLASVTGKRPGGWVSPGHRITERTFEFLVEEGVFWNGDLPIDEVPHHREIGGKRLVIMPRLDYANDHSLVFAPKNPPDVYFEAFKAAFDCLYAEGEAGRPKLVDCLVHAHIGGRFPMAAVFERCLRYAKGFSGVWFCTKGEIAKWYLERYVTQP